MWLEYFCQMRKVLQRKIFIIIQRRIILEAWLFLTLSEFLNSSSCNVNEDLYPFSSFYTASGLPSLILIPRLCHINFVLTKHFWVNLFPPSLGSNCLYVTNTCIHLLKFGKKYAWCMCFKGIVSIGCALHRDTFLDK